VDVDFAAQVCLLGMFGLSGDIAGLPPDATAALQRHITFYKQWRRFIVGSIAHLLTPPRPVTDRTGWAALQLSIHNCRQPGPRLSPGRCAPPASLCAAGLDPDATYVVRRAGDEVAEDLRCTGRQLMRDGLLAEAPGYTRPRSTRSA